MPAALSLNSPESQRVQKYSAPGSDAGRRGGLRRLRYSARRTMFSINGEPVRNLILFMRSRSEAAYIVYKPPKNDAV
jgi:hypothetical protein